MGPSARCKWDGRVSRRPDIRADLSIIQAVSFPGYTRESIFSRACMRPKAQCKCDGRVSLANGKFLGPIIVWDGIPWSFVAAPTLKMGMGPLAFYLGWEWDGKLECFAMMGPNGNPQKSRWDGMGLLCHRGGWRDAAGKCGI